MAKGSGNPAGKQPSSRNSKPYDANNSFVKKVATKVTDFIPQRSWISKWFNTSQGSEDTLDVRENPEESEFIDDVQQPPPSKRPRIRMDVIHPPGTFFIQPRSKIALNTIDPSKKQYSVQNETSDDFLEPATAGPSGIGRLISSTPAIQADIRTVTSHRSDLNSPPTNNGTANGLDDHSESSESTSGCSSLTPQTNRHEGPSNLLQQIYNSSFSSRKTHIGDKLTFTNHLQSPRSLFLDSNSRDTLSSRRPSFNASVMTNALGRASPLSSPFYSGNTTFGGANAAGLYKRGRNVFSDSSELQLKVPRRTNVEVKPSNTVEVDSSGMSQTAKKILEALEHFSSPISDAKRIPMRNADNASPLMSRKRAREEAAATPSARVGLRHLTRELTVPTVPDILKLRRRQKLQDTTLAARKIVSARGEPPPPAQEYHLRTEDDDREKYHGKIRGKSKINLEEEETVEPVNLPNIPLPISTLPNFTFTLPPPPHTTIKATTSQESTFKFASPIKVTDAGKNLQSCNHYTFSNPINAEDNASSVASDSSLPPKTEYAAFAASPERTAASMPNFIWSGSSTAPRLKEKAKGGKDGTVELKSGSVIHVFFPKSNNAESNAGGVFPEIAHTDKTSGFNTDVKSARDADPFGSVSSTATPASNWECSECLIRNSGSDKQCIACKAARANPNDKVPAPPSTADTVAKAKPVANKDCFGSHFKLSTNEWECAACYVRNKQNDVNCVACTAAKPGNKPAAQQTVPAKCQKSDLMEKFKPAEGSWECSGCLLRNNANVITCPCCNTSKPTPMKVSSAKTDAAVESSAPKLTAAEGAPTEAGNSDLMNKFKDSWECPGCLVTNSGSLGTCLYCYTAKPGGGPSKPEQASTTNGFGDKFKKPEGAWICDSCLLQNNAKHTECVACQAAKPGTAKPSEPASSTGGSTLQFKFTVPPSSGGFKFGIDKADSQAKPDTASPLNGFKFGNVQQNSGTAQFTFGIPKEETKTGVVTSSGGSGFQFSVKADKTDAKADQEAKDSPFGAPKSDGSSSKQQPFASSGVPSPAPSFTFGGQKTVFSQPSSNKQKAPLATTAAAESPKATVAAGESTAISGATLPPLATPLAKQDYASQSDARPIFSFGVPSGTSAANSNTSTASTTTTCLPTFAQPSLTFSDSPKTTPQAAVPSFGQAATSSPASLPFGESKIAEATPPPSSDKASVTDAPAFPIVSSSTSLFNSNDSKAPITFGQADKPTVFSAGTESTGAGKPPAYSAPETKIPVFSAGTESKSIFGTQETKLPVFGSGEKTASVFNSPGQAAPTVMGGRFDSTSSIILPFGSSNSSTFDNNAGTPAFGDTTAPGMFSSTKDESNASTLAPIPAFGSNQSAPQQQPASSAGFNFSANTNPPKSGAKQQQPLFVFGGANSNAPSSSGIFGNNTFASLAPTNTANFTFNTFKQQETPPPFRQTSVATPMFGANPQTQATPSFLSTSSRNAGFNFGPTAPPPAPSRGFFGGMSPTSAPIGRFNFNPPASAPTVAFDPNSRPSFNFTKGSAPTAFNAPPQPATAPRKIKKAYRRCLR